MSVESFAPKTRTTSPPAVMGSQSSGWSDRLLGDAASQLCQPLARITDSIAAVIASDSGGLTAQQRESLRDAIAACDQADAIVVGLRRLNRRQEHVNIQRRWFDVSLLKSDAERLIRSLLPHRRDAIRWHGFDLPRRVYGDPSIVSRLLVGLIGSAMRHAGSPMVGGKAIWVRANGLSDRQVLKLSVSVEDGCFFGGDGIQPANIVKEKEDWVELAIWRSFAAALFAHPELTMRPNGGWEIVVDLPIDSPLSVANQWARWRQAQHPQTRAASGQGLGTTFGIGNSLAAQSNRTGDNVNRLLRGLMSANVGPGPMLPSHAAVFTVVAGAAVSPDAIEAFHHKLESDLGMYDFVYRVTSRRWMIVWDVDVAQARTRIETLATANLDTASPIRLQWSTIGTLPIREGQTARILSDRITRELLTDSESGHVAIDHAADTAGIQPSPVPSERLMAEMRHLAARVRVQNEHLMGQARQLRPAFRENR